MDTWSSYVLVPVCLTEDDYRRMKVHGWRAWVCRLSLDRRNHLPDDSEFFIPSARDWYMPTASDHWASKRWTFPLVTSDETPRLPGKDGIPVAEVAWVDIFRFPETSMLVIHLAACRPLDDADVRRVSKAASEWLPKDEGHWLATWRAGGSDVGTLRDWVMAHLLGVRHQQDVRRVNGALHWFGSVAPTLTLLRRPDVPNWSARELTSLITHICLGVEDEIEQYGPSENIRRAIEGQFVQEWENWRLHEWRNRMVMVYGGEARGGQPENTRRYYVPIIASVLYQRVTIMAYLDRFMGGTEDDRVLRRAFIRFRREFLAHRISSYPMGNRVYEFLREVNRIPETFKDVEDELQAADQLTRLELERQETGLIRNLTILAALFMPVSAISSIYGAESTQIHDPWSWFWMISLGATIAVFGVLFYAIRKLKKAGG
ncbi:MAG: hypothetical protein HYU59_07530 [Magnetospirillum gryphiswaldense]|nr:hypothetical protein [Magnetospirillum gryphiswaldense]